MRVGNGVKQFRGTIRKSMVKWDFGRGTLRIIACSAVSVMKSTTYADSQFNIMKVMRTFRETMPWNTSVEQLD